MEIARDQVRYMQEKYYYITIELSKYQGNKLLEMESYIIHSKNEIKNKRMRTLILYFYNWEYKFGL